MEKMVIKGGRRLTGRVHIEGSKNAALPIQAASLLATVGSFRLTNVPSLLDIITDTSAVDGAIIASRSPGSIIPSTVGDR